MRTKACIAAILLAALSQLSACAQKSMSADDLRSNITYALSYAVDADTSLGLFRQGRMTRTFFEAHFVNLADEVRRTLQDLQPGSSTEPGEAARARECQNDLDSLSAALMRARQHSGDAKSLAEAGTQIAAAYKALESIAAK